MVTHIYVELFQTPFTMEVYGILLDVAQIAEVTRLEFITGTAKQCKCVVSRFMDTTLLVTLMSQEKVLL
jgi:hypothetical protein